MYIPSEDQVKHRQCVGKHIYNIWTRNGAEPSGIAPAVFDHRIDTLGRYVVFADGDDDDKDDKDKCSDIVSDSIRVVHCDDLSYAEFAAEYMEANIPIIIDDLVDDWKARKLWTKPDCDDRLVPNVEYIKQTFGSNIAPVHVQEKPGLTCTRPVSTTETIADYIDWWQEYKQHVCDTQQDQPIKYLKDWKFVVSHPHYNAYTWPHYFANDWLNQAMGNAYKFVYLGPKGSATMLHADVLRSFSWSANICGEKEWYMVPPQYTYLLYDCFGKKVASHLFVDTLFLYPGLARARQVAIQVLQMAGQTIFVPSNWFHTVENKQDTLSINHNWLNETNIDSCWRYVYNEYLSIRSSTDDIDYNTTTVQPDVAQTADNSQNVDDIHLLRQILLHKQKSGQDYACIKSILAKIDSIITDNC